MDQTDTRGLSYLRDKHNLSWKKWIQNKQPRGKLPIKLHLFQRVFSRTESHTNHGIPYRLNHYFTAEENGTQRVTFVKVIKRFSGTVGSLHGLNTPSFASFGN